MTEAERRGGEKEGEGERGRLGEEERGGGQRKRGVGKKILD